MYQLIATDLDGTLLNSKTAISPRNLAVLHRLASQGVHICIATGRQYNSACQITACLDFPFTLAAYNGAMVVDRPSGHRRMAHYLDAEVARNVLAELRSFQLPGIIHAFTESVWHVSPMDDHTVADAGKWGVPVAEIPEAWREPAVKIMMVTPRNATQQVLRHMQERFPELNVVLSTPTLLEIMAPKASKGQAVLQVAASFGIDPEAVVAFGDQMNDIDMLTAVGYGIAMGNATEDAKRVARHVTLHHDADGVAVALEKLFALAS